MIHMFFKDLSEFWKSINKVVYYPQTNTAIIYLKNLNDLDAMINKAKQYNLSVSIQISEQKKKKLIVVREQEATKN